VATACLLVAMKQRNFIIGVTFSKTEVLQVGHLRNADPAGAADAGLRHGDGGGHHRRGAAVAAEKSWRRVPLAWNGSAAWFGLASGACFALSAVGYRGAALELAPMSPG
jgi:hypothetical protein